MTDNPRDEVTLTKSSVGVSGSASDEARTNTGNTLEGRIKADASYPFGRVMVNPKEDGCCAILKLGTSWAKCGKPILCSRKALPDNAFCGQHDHLNVLIGASEIDEFLVRAFRRAAVRGVGLRIEVAE